MGPKAGDLRNIATLCLAWVLAVIAVNPVGNFPVVDDWAYAESVATLLAGGGLKFSDWSATNLLSHVVWGAGFAALFGMSPTVLRISTLVAGLLGAMALYRLFRLAKAPPGLSLLGTFAGVFNPLYFHLAFSFMTDVTYAAMQLAAMWLLASGFLFRSRLRQGLGWAMGLCALLCRQLGIFIPMALAAQAVVRRPFSFKRIVLAAIPVVAFLIVQRLFEFWLDATGKTPALYGRQINGIAVALADNPKATIVEAIRLPIYGFYYLGLFMMPLTIPCLSVWRMLLPAHLRRWAIPAVAVASVIVLAVSLALGWQFPMWRDGLNMYNGLGAERMGAPVPAGVAIVLTYLAGLGGVLLTAALVGSGLCWWRRPAEGFDIAIFALMTGLALLAAIALVTLRFDRYLIPVIPCMLLALSPLLTTHAVSRAGLAGGWAAAAAMGLISIVATHDYLAAKRVHWEVYSDLARQVGPTNVDGGWVLNGAASFGKVGTIENLASWSGDADYLVGAYRRDGFILLAAHPVERWLDWNNTGAPILVQRRTP